MKKYCCTLLILLLLIGLVYSASSRDYSYYRQINAGKVQGTTDTPVRDARHFLQVGIALATAPLHFSRADWAKTGVFLATTALLFAIDKDVRHFSLSHQNSSNDHLFRLDRYHGNKYSLGLGFLLYGGGLVTRNRSIRETGLRSVEAFVYAGAVSSLVKGILGRRRPYGGDSQFVFKPFQLKDSFQALPSGHATVAFAVSTVLAKSVDSLPWKFFWYGAAAMVGAARVYHNQHWISDVFFGGVLGYSVANFVVNFPSDSPASGRDNIGQRISPYIAPGTFGIQLYLP